MKKNLAAFFVFFALLAVFPLFSDGGKDFPCPVKMPLQKPIQKFFYPKKLLEFTKCYSDVDFEPQFDIETFDWKIFLTVNSFENRNEIKKNPKKSAVLYWADGRLLPKEELSRKSEYWPLQYHYENRQRDPKTYTQAEIDEISHFGSASSRRNQAGTPMFFFDFIYSAKSRAAIEEHIINTTFLEKRTKIHERILPQVKKVESEILKEAETDDDVKTFVDELKSADAYYWRVILGTSRKSFHSYGISIDVLPARLRGKAIYWSWEKDKLGDRWMMIPLERRWSPSDKVIKIFEKNGFIWGGNWVIFDNMHFEYHPELTEPLKKAR